MCDQYVLPPQDIAKAHADGEIHIHDKDFYTLTETCCQIDLIKLFEQRVLHRPRVPAGALTSILQLRRPGLHRHPGQPERDARRAERAHLSTTPWPRGWTKTFRKEFFEALAQSFWPARLAHALRGCRGHDRQRPRRVLGDQAPDAHQPERGSV